MGQELYLLFVIFLLYSENWNIGHSWLLII